MTYSSDYSIPLVIKFLIFSLAAFIIYSLTVTAKSNEITDSKWKELSVEEYKESIYAFWLGQIIGNTYGLGYEFKFIDEAGPDSFPYGYSFTLDDLKKYNGAFSDDDTDIEYMYLIQMENHGIEPSYYQLAEAWKYHVDQRVWFANRMALTLMHAGHYPPVTGMKGYNSEWFQIDPQLVNEIWSATAPGMVDYGVKKSEFSARITSDDFGLEPTKHYAAMISSAFFEKDIMKLIETGNQAIPFEGKFYNAVKDVIKAYHTYPNNWQKAREKIKNKYFITQDYNRHSWAAVDAVLNGALGIMALLYGEGDFQKTLDYCCAFGMDADNQAATMCGLLGIIGGIANIPQELLYPVVDADWTQPFNDSYKMISRKGLSDITISSLSERTAIQGEKIIIAHGGSIFKKNGKQFYRVNSHAKFIPPFELNSIPNFYLEVNEAFSYPIYTGGSIGKIKITSSGNIPPGLIIKNNLIHGIPTEPGQYEFQIKASRNSIEKIIIVKIVVYSENLALNASKILYNSNALDTNIEIIRDGNTDLTYYSIKPNNSREIDYYGYIWDDVQEISAIIYNCGSMHEFSGWFTSLEVEYMNDAEWVKIDSIRIDPQMNFDNSQWMKPSFMDFTIRIPKIKTRGVRIIGEPGGIEKDAANSYLGIQYYSAISELRVMSH